ncbi:protease synthase and sporulation negative regulatory protein PAI 1 [Oxobacter pfennigii]|uniref:Protease synthase and sporulation negative regulatory protein PAI 1 n=1 Tax=Oxobacter pfennigii TaxID=36849 RepID=A0A0P8Z071_9CLOT|nr:GNAT family N-acetyltransferase [Oxobacter pfennigii]KPU45532.1 protease synthase and sporulation negative regulatory protein PAI 1 [Oxobacter pfennigii]
MEVKILEIFDDDYSLYAEVVSKSFLTVAREFNFTEENAPTNPAFIKPRHIMRMKEKGINMFGLFLDNICIGFVAVEKIDNECFCMERLSVLPEYRHKGYGNMLVNFIFDFVKKFGGKKITIGIVNDNEILKRWYIKKGFCQTGTKTFEHLPFEVGYMERTI